MFLLLHLVGLVGYNLLLRKSLVAKVDRWTLATVMQTGIAIPMVFVVLIHPPHLAIFTPMILLRMSVIVLLVISLHATNVQALHYLEASVYSILYNLRIIFTTVLGVVFVNERVVPLQILGGLCIFLGIVFVRQKGRKDLTGKGIEWGLAAAVVISVLNLFEKRLITDIGYLSYAAPVMLTAAVVMWSVLLARGKRIKISFLREPKTLQLMGFRTLSAYGFSLAFNAGGLLSVSSYISSLSVIMIVLLGIWLLGERDYLKQKLLATALAVLGLTFILIANLR